MSKSHLYYHFPSKDALLAGLVRFGQIEIKRGIFPFGGATLRLPQVAGWGNAMRYLLTGDSFDGAEALRILVVERVLRPALVTEAWRSVAALVPAPLDVDAEVMRAALAPAS